MVLDHIAFVGGLEVDEVLAHTVPVGVPVPFVVFVHIEFVEELEPLGVPVHIEPAEELALVLE